MKGMEEEQAVINRLVQWAERQALVRAVLLTSSRANPYVTVDDFSDYKDILGT